ncbi:hypothetical protein AHMF7605_22535 [Adhaeribacter arboris]|uniref:Uncharacterized protein n=1 Tax=Adhaeribacter arboris TaxID=2072846 RepID=A0A2T2YKR4_9BACT|nr:hypothetical protein [Adhaeribacter arboris]PSR56079.1 hypothetical protein AHMF7605_22535 [Adhaeribacter arboris]
MKDNILSTSFKKWLEAFLGFFIGVFYGIILTLLAASIYVWILHTFYHYHQNSEVSLGSGLFGAMLHSILGTTLFYPIFGNSQNKTKRIVIGTTLGLIAGANLGRGFLYPDSVQVFGEVFFIIYTSYFGALGGFLVGLTSRKVLDIFVNKSKSYEVDLNPTTAGIWSAIIGGIFAVLVSIISINTDFWKEDKESELYVVIYSAPNFEDAKNFALTKINKDFSPEVYFTSNGSYAVTIGLYESSKAKYIKDNAIKHNLISKNSFLIGSKGIIKKVYP